MHGRRMAATLLSLGVAMGVSEVRADEPGLVGRDDVLLQDGFESSDWYLLWGLQSAPQNTEVVADADALSGDSVLRVSVPAGEHYGTSFGFDFADANLADPDEAHFRYAIRLGPTWSCEVGGGKLPGWGGTYGIAGWGGNPSDGTNGWSARGLFWPPDSGADTGATRVGFYTYHADMPGIYGDNWYWSGSSLGADGVMQRGVWYQVEVYARMNTPTQNDGVLRAWVDGTQVYEKTDIRFRDVDTLHIERAWFDNYYGGTWVAPADMYLDYDNVVVAYEYIGPYSEDPGTGGAGGSSSGSGGSTSSGGTGGGTSSSGSGGSTSGANGAHGDPEDGSGCDCRLGGAPARGGPLAYAIGLVLLLRRRRH